MCFENSVKIMHDGGNAYKLHGSALKRLDLVHGCHAQQIKTLPHNHSCCFTQQQARCLLLISNHLHTVWQCQVKHLAELLELLLHQVSSQVLPGPSIPMQSFAQASHAHNKNSTRVLKKDGHLRGIQCRSR